MPIQNRTTKSTSTTTNNNATDWAPRRVQITTADVEQAVPLNANLKKVILKNPTVCMMRISAVANGTDNGSLNYFELAGSEGVCLDELNFSSKTIYVRCNIASRYLQIWETFT